MKYPNPTFLNTAEKVRHTRRNITIIVIVCLCLITAVVLFVLKMASMQERYRQEFPELVGAATSTTTTVETTRKTHATTTTTTTETTVETTTELAPSFATTTTIETTTTTEPTEQVNTPDVFKELDENVYFFNKHPLQTVSHDIRDQRLDILKQSLENYINNCDKKERVCIYYANLSNNETMGVNELSPIVPAGAYNLPIEIAYYDMAAEGLVYQYDLVTYNSDVEGNSSYISETYDFGKQFYLRTLAYYAIAANDNVALTMLMNRIGGESLIYYRTNEMSCYINYTEDILYTNNLGESMRGPHRSSCYDMVEFAKRLYTSYKNNPSAYQPLINDMASSVTPSGYNVAFGEDAIVLHVLGRNSEYGAYTDVAIIDCEEPIAICIYVECKSENRAMEITAGLSNLIAAHISGLHEN